VLTPVLLVGGALVVLALGAWAVHRRPELLALAAAAALPFRVPIESGGDTANLLVPLYLVIAAGVLAYAMPRLGAAGRREPAERERGLLDWLLAGTLVLYAVQAAYSSDFDNALSQVIFFYVPFALLYALLRRIEWTPQLAGRCLVVLHVLAVAFVGIGFVEYAKRELLLNPKVISSNQFESYFRVNSLFFDPNIYGRFLAMVMLLVVAWLLWTPRRRDMVVCAVVLAVLWGGLVLTLSQSSFAALLIGLAVLGAMRWSARKAAALAAALLVAGAAFVLLAPGAVRLDLGSSKSANSATSGRYDLISGGAGLFADRPLQGWGSGAFPRQYRRAEHVSAERATSASHTIPVTVAAEQGVIGLAVYVALLVCALWRLLRGARVVPARAGVAAALVALLAHTMMYAAFLEDPLAWTLLAVGTALGVAAGRRRAIVPPEGEPTARERATAPA
jgi:O-antigen ligase